jgi:electron transport complex protein RnfB
MDNEIYEKIRASLDRFPTSFPKTEDGTEIRLLKKLFSPEEAEIAVELPLMQLEDLETVQTIADRMGKKTDEVEPLLNAMSKRGVVYVTGPAESRVFALLPFVPGIYECTSDLIDREFAEYLQLVFNAMRDERKKGAIPLGRWIPIGESLDSTESSIHPYNDVIKAIEASSSICVMPCACRVEAKVLGHGCDHPIEVCMALNSFADYLNDIGKGRKLTKDEAISLIKECEDAGLVHQTSFMKEFIMICSCCGCSCNTLKGLISAKRAGATGLVGSLWHSDYRMVVNRDACTGCETCVDRCWIEALSLEEGKVVLDKDWCITCGACVSTCPSEALYLERKPEGEIEPMPENYDQLLSKMGWRKSNA